MLRDPLGKVHHAPEESICPKQFTFWIQEKESRQIGSAKKSEDTPLETPIASNPHLPTAKLHLANVSAQQLYLKCFYQSKLFSPLPLMQSLWFDLPFFSFLLNFVCCVVLNMLIIFSYLHRPHFCFFFSQDFEDPGSNNLNYRDVQTKTGHFPGLFPQSLLWSESPAQILDNKLFGMILLDMCRTRVSIASPLAHL